MTEHPFSYSWMDHQILMALASHLACQEGWRDIHNCHAQAPITAKTYGSRAISLLKIVRDVERQWNDGPAT